MLLEAHYIELNELWYALTYELDISWSDPEKTNTWRHCAHQRVFNKVLADLGYTVDQWNDYIDIMWDEHKNNS